MVSFAHGTTGLGDKCAPSLSTVSLPPNTNAFLDNGWIVSATDYEGLGTPGILPYLAGTAAARDSIDIVRATRQLVHDVSRHYVVTGHSEGGQTALFALHIAASYAPDLHLDGVIAGAPPSQMQALYTSLENSPFRYYLFMMVLGLHAAYGNSAPVDPLLTTQGRSLVPLVESDCLTLPQFAFVQPTRQLLQYKLRDVSIKDIFRASPFSLPAWRAVLTANDPESFAKASLSPLLIFQGDSDAQIPVQLTRSLSLHLCGLGQPLETWIYPRQTHAGVVVASGADVVHWVADRFAGSPLGSYVPTGQGNVEHTLCRG